MAQGSRQIQTQAQQQIQTLSPQQILVVKLLELPAIELEDRVRAELLENPALEEGKDDTSGDEYSNTPDADSNAEDGGDTDYDSLSDYLNEDDIPDYKLQENNHSKGEQAEEIPFSDTTSFYETLKEQLGERNLTEHQRELAEYLIGSLDDDGLLRKSLDSISDELAIYAGIEATTGELEEALRIIQDFDPAGLGARNLQECLLIQIRRKIEQQHFTPNPILYIEEAIISECYEDFTRKHWDKIQQKLGLEEEAFQQAIKEICTEHGDVGAVIGVAFGEHGHLADDDAAGLVDELLHRAQRLAGRDHIIDDDDALAVDQLRVRLVEHERLHALRRDGLDVYLEHAAHVGFGLFAGDEIFVRAALAGHFVHQRDGFRFGCDQVVIFGRQLEKLGCAVHGQLHVAEHDERADVQVVRDLAQGQIAL